MLLLYSIQFTFLEHVNVLSESVDVALNELDIDLVEQLAQPIAHQHVPLLHRLPKQASKVDVLLKVVELLLQRHDAYAAPVEVLKRLLATICVNINIVYLTFHSLFNIMRERERERHVLDGVNFLLGILDRLAELLLVGGVVLGALHELLDHLLKEGEILFGHGRYRVSRDELGRLQACLQLDIFGVRSHDQRAQIDRELAYVVLRLRLCVEQTRLRVKTKMKWMKVLAFS